MNANWGMALMLTGCLMAAPAVCARAQGDGQTKTDPKTKTPAETAPQQSAPQQTPPPATDPNAFPTDTSDVPVLPSKTTADTEGTFSDPDHAAASLPGEDVDPVKSPDAAADDGNNIQELTPSSSSSVKGLDNLLPGPDDEDTGKRRRKGDAIQGPPKETAQQDVTVGKYYMDQKNWKAAQSRFQSALVLSPEDPEVYWGLAESARHLGKIADARANYEKVIAYDPDSRHAKDAKKILKDPEMAGK